MAKKANWKLPYIPLRWLSSKNYLKPNLTLSKFRNAIITKSLVGLRANIYNGAWLLTKTFDERMVGCKVGEFSITKRFDAQAQNKRKTKRKTKTTKL